MHLKTIVPLIGFGAASVLSSSALANQHEWWAVNCKTSKCLQATAEAGKVIVSECQLGTLAQEWEVMPAEGVDREVATEGTIESFGIPGNCLAVVNNQVMTKACHNQQWQFPALRAVPPSNRVGQIKPLVTTKPKPDQCLTVEGDDKVLLADCQTAPTASQSWYWVNVGSRNFCPSSCQK